MTALTDDRTLQLSWRWLKIWLLIAAIVLGILLILHWYLDLPNDGCALRALGFNKGSCGATSAALISAARCPVRLYLWLDFVFIAGYIGTLYTAVRWAQVASLVRQPGSEMLRLVFCMLRWTAVLVLGACAAVDLSENFLTLAAIERAVSGESLPFLAEWKFRLFFWAVGLALIAVVLQRAVPAHRSLPSTTY